MKHNLLLSYSTFLIFYLMLKAEGRDVKNHPVVFKLAHMKTLLDKLVPIDTKVDFEVDRVLKATQTQDNDNISSSQSQDSMADGS